MITVSTFLQQVEPKFEGWLWADYEAKFFGDDLYIKASTDFSYYHLFDLYVRQAKISTFLPEWTTDLREEKLFKVHNGSLVFKTGKLDHNIDLIVEGTEILVSVYDVYYRGAPAVPQPSPSVIDGYYFNLEEIDHVYDLDRFQQLILK